VEETLAGGGPVQARMASSCGRRSWPFASKPNTHKLESGLVLDLSGKVRTAVCIEAYDLVI